ncbi:MAG TPA: peptidyl-prolyl cis-trans isomerase [bacterium]|nr:peptidyl-prolyl cis-trans isomerase [bacterium]
MNKRMPFFTLLLVILSASVLLGCNREKPLVIPDLQDALATYDENTITADDLVMMCSTRSHRMEILAKSVSETNWAETRLTELQQERILSERAREQGLDQDPEFVSARDNALADTVIRLYLRDKVDRKITLTEKDFVKYYEFNKQKYTSPLRFRFNQVWIDVKKWGQEEGRKRAQSALARLQAGEGSVPVLSEFSDREGEDRFKPLGDYKKGEIPYTELEEAVLSTPKGSFSDVVETPLGFHIVVDPEITPESIMSLEEARPEVRELLFEEKQKEKQEALYESLAKRINPVIRVDLIEKTDVNPAEVVLKVGEKKVTSKDFKYLLSKSPKKMTPREVLQGIAERMMLYEAAIQEKYAETKSFKKAFSFIEAKMLSDFYLNKVASDQPDPTDEDVEKFYSDFPHLFYREKEIEPSEIVIKAAIRPDMTRYEKLQAMQDAEQRIRDARRQILDGLPFSIAALMSSESETRSQGGKMTRRTWGTGPKFDNVAFFLDEGQISEPVEMDDGYQLIWVRASHDRFLPSFDEVREDALARLKRTRYKEKRATLLEETSQASPLKVDAELLGKWKAWLEQTAKDVYLWSKI